MTYFTEYTLDRKVQVIIIELSKNVQGFGPKRGPEAPVSGYNTVWNVTASIEALH